MTTKKDWQEIEAMRQMHEAIKREFELQMEASEARQEKATDAIRRELSNTTDIAYLAHNNQSKHEEVCAVRYGNLELLLASLKSGLESVRCENKNAYKTLLKIASGVILVLGSTTISLGIYIWADHLNQPTHKVGKP